MRAQAVLVILMAATTGLVGCSGISSNRTKLLLPDSTLSTLRNQGFRLFLESKYTESEAAYRQALQLLSQHKSSLSYANTCLDLSRVLAQSARPQEAIAMAQQAVTVCAAMSIRTSSVAFAWTQALIALSDYYQSAGRFSLSRESLSTALQLSKQYLSADVQAKVKEQADELNEPSPGASATGASSEQAVLRALFTDRAQLPVVQALHQAQTQEVNGAWQDAIATLKAQSQACASDTTGGAQPKSALAAEMLLDEAAHIAWLHRDFKQAAQLGDEARRLQTNLLWPDHPSARRNRTWLACYYHNDRQLDKSSALIRSEYERYGVNLPAPTKPELIDCLSGMVQQEDIKRNWSWSLPASLRVFKLAQSPPAAEPLTLSELAATIGDRVFLTHKNKQDAMKWYQKSLAYLGPAPEQHGNLYGHLLLRLGGTEDALGERVAAQKHIEAALPYLRAHRPSDVGLANTYLEMYKSTAGKKP